MLIKLFNKISNWFLFRPKTTGFIAFFGMLLVVIFVISLRHKIIKENEGREMSNILRVVQQNFEQILKNSYTTTLTLAMTIDDNGVPHNFEKISEKLVNNNSSVDAVQLVPNGVIKYVYPLKGNEAALNYDILKTNTVRQEAEKSIKSKLIYFAGPMELKQGGIAVIGRLPIFKDDKFWGFSAVLIKLETLIKNSGINSINQSKYYFQFSKKNPQTGIEEFFLPNKTDFSKNFYKTAYIPEGNWKLYLISNSKNVFFNQIITSLVFGLLLSIMFGIWIYTILKKPAEQQLLILRQAKKLIESEVEFKTLFNQAPVGIAKLETSTGKFVEINKEYCRITGYSKNELKHLSFEDITHPEDLQKDLDLMKKLVNDEIDEFSLEKRYYHKSGKIIWVNIIVARLWKIGEEKTNHIAIVEDITEKKEVEKSVKKSFNLVNEQNKRLLNFSYIVSHNLRSHSSNINSISNLLEDSDDDEEKKELIAMLKKVSESLNETMSNLNDVVNIQSNVHLTKEKLNLYNYIKSTIHILSEQIFQKDAIINNLVEKEVLIIYNAAYLESILLNFISNSLKYSHPERRPIINISFDKEKKELKIADNGLGIDLKKHGSSLFGMYKTFHKNKDAKGIGLFITKNQIEAMEGSVTVESEVNIGTTFIVHLKTNS
ncbi:PAS domain S-box protein [Flavobacterium sp.]|jgi:PAS domain S-box-containing protein|uniref:PAS domain S-box protein n=1 Tax=Flavobacterium sp. TaxID=239 RepID=UPI0037C0965D